MAEKRTFEQTIKLIESRAIPQEDGCHKYETIAIARHPRIYYDGRQHLVVRLIMGLEWEDPRTVMHTCNKSYCVNKEHLVLATKEEVAKLTALKRKENKLNKTNG